MRGIFDRNLTSVRPIRTVVRSVKGNQVPNVGLGCGRVFWSAYWGFNDGDWFDFLLPTPGRGPCYIYRREAATPALDFITSKM